MGNPLYYRATILIMARYFLNIQLTIMNLFSKKNEHPNSTKSFVNKTKKLFFISLILLSFTFAAHAQRGVRIGYIDMEYILQNVPEYTEASLQLEGKVQRWKNDIEKKIDEVEQMKINLSTERVLLTDELIDEREEDIKILEDKMLKYQQDRFGPDGDLYRQRRQLVQPIQDQVFNIVQEVAENKKYDFIFDKSADIVMLFSADRHDISDIVLRSINRSAKRKEVKTRKEKKEVTKRDEISLEEDKAITEREEAVEEKVAEREKAIEEKKSEREAIMEDRKRVRDSVRDARKLEYETRRQELLEERERRKDSIMAARAQKLKDREENNQNNNGDNEDEENNDGSNK